MKKGKFEMGAIVFYVDPDDGKLYVHDDFMLKKSEASILIIPVQIEDGRIYNAEFKRHRLVKFVGDEAEAKSIERRYIEGLSIDQDNFVVNVWWSFEGNPKDQDEVIKWFQRWLKEGRIPRKSL